MKKSIEDFKATTSNLENCLKMSRGDPHMYRTVATHLWVLLGDRDALIPRLFSAKFHPLILKPESKMNEYKKEGNQHEWNFNFIIPGLMESDKGKLKVLTIFDESKKPIKFKQWINQPLFAKDFTIKDFLRLIRHKEGAHSDRETPEKLRLLKVFFIQNDALTKVYTEKIAEYVLNQCKIMGARLPNS